MGYADSRKELARHPSPLVAHAPHTGTALRPACSTPLSVEEVSVPFPKYQRVTGEPYMVCERFMQMRGPTAVCVKAPFWKAQLERVTMLPRPRGEAAKNDFPNRRIFDFVPLFAFQRRRKRRGPMPDNRPKKPLPVQDSLTDLADWYHTLPRAA